MLENLEKLINTIRERKASSPDKSYTNRLLNDKKLSVAKVKEEIEELIEAVEKNSNKIHEAADVIYHLMVYLETNNIKIENLKNLKLNNNDFIFHAGTKEEENEIFSNWGRVLNFVSLSSSFKSSRERALKLIKQEVKR